MHRIEYRPRGLHKVLCSTHPKNGWGSKPHKRLLKVLGMKIMLAKGHKSTDSIFAGKAVKYRLPGFLGLYHGFKSLSSFLLLSFTRGKNQVGKKDKIFCQTQGTKIVPFSAYFKLDITTLLSLACVCQQANSQGAIMIKA
jgi:hypothetical protein